MRSSYRASIITFMERTYFSKILGELMTEHALTQLELADALGVRQSTIHSWLFDNRLPSFHYIRLVCDYFDVSADMIIDTKFDD